MTPRRPRCGGYDVQAAQRGQTLVEVVVLAAALLPLLFAIPLIAKYQDVRMAAIAASRTTVFECSLRPEHCSEPQLQAALADDLRRRHFARHAHDLLTNDVIADDAPSEQRNRFWVDRRGRSLVARSSDVQLDVTVGQSDAGARAWAGSNANRGGAGASAEAIADAASGLANPAAFGLDLGHGMVSARLRADVSPGLTLAQWLRKADGMHLALRGKTVTMIDAWNASSAKGDEPRSFEARVEQGRRLPALAGGPADEAIDLLYAPIRELVTGPLLAPIEPRGRLFKYHEIDVDLVPADRIGPP